MKCIDARILQIMLLWLLGCSSAFADVYWRPFNNDIKRADDDGSNITTVVTPASNGSAFSIDKSNNKLYWNEGGTIKRANLDGSSIETVFTGLSNPNSPSFDSGNSHLYISDFNNNNIRRIGFDGTGDTTILSNPNVADPSGTALDLTNNKVYWIHYNSQIIRRANLDGSSIETLINSGLSQGVAVAVDPANNKMYFTDRSKLQSANLDGTGVATIDTSYAQGLDLDLASGKVYWGTAVGEVKRANLDGTGVETLFTGAGNIWTMAYMPSKPTAAAASVNLLDTAAPVYFSRKLADH